MSEANDKNLIRLRKAFAPLQKIADDLRCMTPENRNRERYGYCIRERTGTIEMVVARLNAEGDIILLDAPGRGRAIALSYTLDKAARGTVKAHDEGMIYPDVEIREMQNHLFGWIDRNPHRPY